MIYNIFFLALLCTHVVYTFKGTNRAKDNNRIFRHKKSLKPNKISSQFDNNVIALQFDSECLGDTDPNDMLETLTSQYPCITPTRKYKKNTFRRHGNIYRGYFKIKKNDNCLENNEIEWNDYCIKDITFDMMLNIQSISCTNDNTNSIYYNSTKKNDAWYLDILDNKNINNDSLILNINDNKYLRPNINNDGDDHGVDIWILDSGINPNHYEFYKGQIVDEYANLTTTNAHGTAVASVAGGNNYGVSKGFIIHDYVVCRSANGCNFADVDSGLHLIIDHMKTTGRRSVINLSLGTSGANNTNMNDWKAYYDALFLDVINAGGIIIVSAGNSNQNACDWWFSYSNHVISVGSHDNTLKRSSFSNYGDCVDIYAPGSSVPAAYSNTDPSFITTVSGTSIAAPVITGIVTNLLYENNTRTKDDIVSLLQSDSYPISNCNVGICKGAYYHCSNKIDGCCTSIRGTAMLNRMCKSYTAETCQNGRNADICYVNPNKNLC